MSGMDGVEESCRLSPTNEDCEKDLEVGVECKEGAAEDAFDIPLPKRAPVERLRKWRVCSLPLSLLSLLCILFF